MQILRTENISKTYGDREIVKDINITLNKGELVSLLGVSGSGKTTIFNLISGLQKPDEGQIILEDNDITGQAGKISYMLQKDLLFQHKTIVDNVALPLIIKGVRKKEARKRAAEAFEAFGLGGCEKRYPSQLSGGMRQRAALLRTYLASDGVALLDEPFSALDTLSKGAMHKWYLEVMEHIDLSTLFITHDIDEAILLSDRVYILSGSPGRIVAEIKIEEPKPRDKDFTLTEKFLEIKKNIIESLHI